MSTAGWKVDILRELSSAESLLSLDVTLSTSDIYGVLLNLQQSRNSLQMSEPGAQLPEVFIPFPISPEMS